VLAATEVVPVATWVSSFALRLGCALEAVGYGAATLAAVGGWTRAEIPRGLRGARLVFSAVLGGLALRHGLLTVDPMGGQPAMQSVGFWVGALVAWAVIAVAARQSVPKAVEAPVRVQLLWLGAVGVVGGLNTLAMAARRAVL
jgi:hypothetical protein